MSAATAISLNDADLAPEDMEGWLRTALDIEAEIHVLRGRLRRAERNRNTILRVAATAGVTRAADGAGAVIIKTTWPRARMIDVAKFRQAYPDVFDRIAVVSIPLWKAEQEIGKAAVAEMCTIRAVMFPRRSVSYEIVDPEDQRRTDGGEA